MKYLTVMLALILTCVAAAQTAKVISLKPDDAREAKLLWENLQSAQKNWDDFNARVAKDYTRSSDCAVLKLDNSGNLLPACSISGFENGFTFSEDFKMIVPKPYMSYFSGSGNNCYYYDGSWHVYSCNGNLRPENGTIWYN